MYSWGCIPEKCEREVSENPRFSYVGSREIIRKDKWRLRSSCRHASAVLCFRSSSPQDSRRLETAEDFSEASNWERYSGRGLGGPQGASTPVPPVTLINDCLRQPADGEARPLQGRDGWEACVHNTVVNVQQTTTCCGTARSRVTPM